MAESDIEILTDVTDSLDIYSSDKEGTDKTMPAEWVIQWLPIAEFVMNLLVAITTVIALVLLYHEVREMKLQSSSLGKSIQANTYQALLDSERALFDTVFSSDEFLEEYFADLHLEVPGLLPRQIRALSATINFDENLYFQYEQGAIPPALWRAWQRFLKDKYSGQRMRRVWPRVKQWYYERFVEYIDRLVVERETKQNQEEAGDED